MIAWILSGLGLVILLLAGDSLVKGAVNLSLRLGVPALIVSLTIVAFGTSAPELLIAIKAVLEHSPGIALGSQPRFILLDEPFAGAGNAHGLAYRARASLR